MNSRERRILHLALRDETDVRSESVGEGPIRQVVIVPADMKTLPEPVIPPKPRPEAGFDAAAGPRRLVIAWPGRPRWRPPWRSARSRGGPARRRGRYHKKRRVKRPLYQ